jgi:para-aminobenzoate synthetase component 1
LLGYCSYELGEQLQLKNKPGNSVNNAQLDTFPSLFIGHYTWSYVFDHRDSQGYLTFSPLCCLITRKKVLDAIEASTNKRSDKESNIDHDIESKESKESKESHLNSLSWTKSQTISEYKSQFDQIENYINCGDCYQVNLTQRFEAKSYINATDLYFTSREKIQTPYSCFISFNDTQSLLSFSPEQFISIKGRIIESRPIKGTIINNGNADNINVLQDSKKNRAENVMIVDLIRNDLGRVCKPNSIHVPELFKVETYKNVHHLVSHIKGTLKDGVSKLEAFMSCFPGGSITGAPKIRSMQIINELEKHPRSAYCGSVFYLNHNGDFDSNILIRTVIKDAEQLYCWAGGGIVADSEFMDEYQESLTKVANITGIEK